MIDLSAPNHPLLLQARRHMREGLFSAERFGRMANNGNNPPKAATVSLALQILLSTVMTDGTDAQDAYSGIAGFLGWAIKKLPDDDRERVFGAIVQAVMIEVPAVTPTPEAVN